jgi:hypothetical protein
MPPVPLPVPTPNLPFSNIANVVPHPPNDPPSVADVIAAKNYAQRALTAGERVPSQSRISAIPQPDRLSDHFGRSRVYAFHFGCRIWWWCVVPLTFSVCFFPDPNGQPLLHRGLPTLWNWG